MAWRGTRRQPVRPTHLLLAFALLLATALGSTQWLTHAHLVRGPEPTAQVAGVVGVSLRIGDNGAARPPVILAEHSTLKVGDVLQTRPGARLSLRRPGGLSIQIGPATEAIWDSPDDLRVLRGVVYIETESPASRDPLVIVTHAGRIRHVGTRFGVQVSDQLVRVTVRDGLVRISAARHEQDLGAGHQGLLRADGAIESSPLATDAGPWNWMQGEATRFAIEGRSLHDVATELAAASGHALGWSTTNLARDAAYLKLHGPALDMDPRAALDAILMTTRFAARDAGRDTDGTARLEVVLR